MNEYDNTYPRPQSNQLESLTDREIEFIRDLRRCGEDAVNYALKSQEQHPAVSQKAL